MTYIMPRKDVDAKLDYLFDWSDWLEEGEIILNRVVTVSDNSVLEAHTEDAGKITVWISGGVVGEWITASCRISTQLDTQSGEEIARIDERTIKIHVEER